MTRNPLSPVGARGRWRAAAWIAGIWTFVAVLRATQRYLRGGELEPDPYVFWSALGDNLFLAALWAAATALVMRIARRFPFPGESLARLVPVHLAAAVAAALAHTLVSSVAYKLFLAPGVGWDELFRNFATSALMTGPSRLATYFEIVAVTWGLDDYRAYREKELRASLLQAELAEARLDALKLQLHPTFLFNALAVLRPTIHRDPRAAARLVVELGDLLRLSLKNGAARLVPLREELKFLELYLKIEKTRLGGKLAVSIRADRGVLDAAVPSLLLQPLAEAALAAGGAELSRIDVEARQRDGRLTLAVRAGADPPASGGAAGLPRASVAAIARARRRLQHEYPGDHSIEWDAAGRATAVEIPCVPLADETGAAAAPLLSGAAAS